MSAPLRRIGLLTALHKPQALESTRELAQALVKAGVEVLLDPRMAEVDLPGARRCATEEWAQESDLIIALGGDGTLLAAARRSAPAGVPLLGVDLGGFGFLAEEQFERVREALPELLAGEFALEERLMLRACVRRGEAVEATLEGMNDAVIAKSEPLRLVHLRTWVNGEFVANYPTDGLIVSTPTGSTAYNLSAGGPLVDPQVECLILAPICPHTLYSRPLVIPAGATLRVQVGKGPHETPPVTLTVDGQLSAPLEREAEVTVSAAPYRAKLVRLGRTTFYGRLREKLRWGEER